MDTSIKIGFSGAIFFALVAVVAAGFAVFLPDAPEPDYPPPTTECKPWVEVEPGQSRHREVSVNGSTVSVSLSSESGSLGRLSHPDGWYAETEPRARRIDPQPEWAAPYNEYGSYQHETVLFWRLCREQ